MHKPPSFPPNRFPKNAGIIRFMFVGGLVSPKWARITGHQPIGGFFHLIEVRQPIGRKDYVQAVCRNEEIKWIFE